MTGKDEETDLDGLEKLAREAQSGSRSAYMAFLEALYPYTRGIVCRRLGPVVDADDLTQECLLGIHKSLATYHPSRRIKPWIHAIIRYKTADYFRALARRRNVEVSRERIDVTSEAAPPNSRSETSLAERVDIRALVMRLPGPLRRAVTLTKLEGFSCVEAAAQEGVAEATLRKRVSRAYRKLAHIVESELSTEDDRGW